MFTKKMTIGVTVVLLIWASIGLAGRDYTYELIVRKSSDPNYDPNSHYDTINGAVLKMIEYSPNEANLGCIRVYDGEYTEHLNDAYEDSNNLPAHCDLIGMGAEVNDVVIRHTPGVWPWPGAVNGNGDNVISHLWVHNYGDGVERGVRLEANSKLEDCIVDSRHGAVIGQGANLEVTGCQISSYFMPCIWASDSFTVTNCELEPKAYDSSIEIPTGICAGAPGTIEDVNINASCESSYHVAGSGVSGIMLKLYEDEEVSISNVRINLQLTSRYDPNQTAPIRVCGIISGNGSVDWPGTWQGSAVVRDCTIDVNGIEGAGAGAIMVDGICIRGGGTIDVRGQTEITTSRTGNDANGYEYSLNNENGTMLVCAAPNAVIYDANKTNGTIDEFLVVNETQDSYYLEIQDAIDDANSGDDIVAYPVTYYETVDFNGLGISLSSSDPSDPEVVAATIIDANGANKAVHFHNSETSTSVLTGFTVTGADHGIYCDGVSPVIENCVIRDNQDTGEDGAGMYNDDASPSVTGCVFSNNWADYGAGMYNYDESCPTVTNCLFYDNDADECGGGMYNDYDSCPTIVNCTFFENTAEYGGGIYNEDDSDAQLTNCIFWGNDADDGEEIYNDDAEPTFSDCCIRGGLNGGYCGGDPSADDGGNIDDDPEFEDDTDPEATDNIWATCDDGLRIKSTSPCKDVGKNSAVEGIDTDIKGSDRKINNTVDMGAYEYDSGC